MHMGIMPLALIPKQHILYKSLLHNRHLFQIQSEHIVNEPIAILKMLGSKMISQV